MDKNGGGAAGGGGFGGGYGGGGGGYGGGGGGGGVCYVCQQPGVCVKEHKEKVCVCVCVRAGVCVCMCMCACVYVYVFVRVWGPVCPSPAKKSPVIIRRRGVSVHGERSDQLISMGMFSPFPVTEVRVAGGM